MPRTFRAKKVPSIKYGSREKHWSKVGNRKLWSFLKNFYFFLIYKYFLGSYCVIPDASQMCYSWLPRNLPHAPKDANFFLGHPSARYSPCLYPWLSSNPSPMLPLFLVKAKLCSVSSLLKPGAVLWFVASSSNSWLLWESPPTHHGCSRLHCVSHSGFTLRAMPFLLL